LFLFLSFNFFCRHWHQLDLR